MSSSSEEEEHDVSSNADEQWDDMAIVRAFEDALSDQRQRAEEASSSRKKTVKQSRGSSSKKKNSRRVSVDGEDAASLTAPRMKEPAASPAFSYTGAAAASSRHDQATAAFTPQLHAGPQGMPSGFETGSSYDIYQLAYAQAYASLQAQHQASLYQQAATTAPQQYPVGYGYGYGGGQRADAGFQSAYIPSQHFQSQTPSSMPVPPFAAPPGVSAGTAGPGDEGLSNLLLAWYQSGYYTGRYQAMQEMKARERR